MAALLAFHGVFMGLALARVLDPICMIAPIILGGTVAEAVYLYMTPKDRHDIR
jgi:hypothetical protein